MRVLILSCNNGGGHNSVAAAVQELYAAHGTAADVVDVLSFLPPGWSKLSSEVHSYAYCNTPELFRKCYARVDTHRQQFERGHPARNLLDLGISGLGKFITEHHYEQVLCCHVFAGIMLTDAIRRQKLSLKTGIIETDYTVTPGAETCELDWHFVPTGKQRAALCSFGVSEACVKVTGIPVRQQFFRSLPRPAAKEQLGLDGERKNIVIACGSMGCGPLKELPERLAANPANDVSVTVLCGSNQKLYESLTGEFLESSRVKILGRVQNMSLVLDSADVYVTKPGGISVTEAAQKRLPMVLVDAVGGCEQYNMDFFVGKGGAVTASDVDALAGAALQICRDEARHAQMSAALAHIFAENDHNKIYETMTENGQ